MVRHLIKYQVVKALCGNLALYPERHEKSGNILSSEQESEMIFYLHFKEITLVAEWRTECDQAKQSRKTI